MKISDRIQTQLITNLKTQAIAINDRQARSPFIVGKYSSRESDTGLRRITSASGGISFGVYQSTSKPLTYPPLTSKGAIGFTGFIDQKPA
jgi:hypothetical protein